MAEQVAAFLMVAGGVFCFSAALGLVRFPDVFMRMHAATKAGTLGILLLAIGQMLVAGDLSVFVRALLIAVFIIATAPIGAHLIGRAAYRTGAPIWDRTTNDPGVRIFPRATAVDDPQLSIIDDTGLMGTVIAAPPARGGDGAGAEGAGDGQGDRARDGTDGGPASGSPPSGR